MVRLIILSLSIIVGLLFTINAFWLQWNGVSTVEILNRLPVLFAPSNYVFLFWIVLFVFLIIWVLKYFQLHKGNQTPITSVQVFLSVFIVLFQISSIIFWHNEQFIISLILMGLQLILLFLLYLTYPLKKEAIQLRYPIAMYFSWTLFLFILYFCYLLVHIEWNGFGLSKALWAVLLMTLGVAIMMHLRYHHHDIVSPLVFIWCYVGIAISNGFDELLVSTAALFLSGVMIVGIIFIKKNPSPSK